MPAEVRRRRAHQQRAQFVQLSAGCRDHDHGRALHSGEWLGRVSKENPNDRAGEMLVRRGDDAVTPRVANSLGQRRNHPLQHSLRAQLRRPALERVLQRARVKRLHGGDAFSEECCGCRGRGQRTPGKAVGGDRFLGELAQLRGRQLRDVADAVSGLRDVAQQTQPLDLHVRVKAAVRSRALGLHGAVYKQVRCCQAAS